jgi:hypothetical protein
MQGTILGRDGSRVEQADGIHDQRNFRETSAPFKVMNPYCAQSFLSTRLAHRVYQLFGVMDQTALKVPARQDSQVQAGKGKRRA